MSDEQELWQSQSAGSARLTTRKLEEMEKNMGRSIYDFYAAMIGIAIVITGIAALFPNVLLTLGALFGLEVVVCGPTSRPL